MRYTVTASVESTNITKTVTVISATGVLEVLAGGTGFFTAGWGVVDASDKVLGAWLRGNDGAGATGSAGETAGALARGATGAGFGRGSVCA